MTRREELVTAVRPLVQATIPVVLLLPRTKRPIPRTEPIQPWGRVAVITNPDLVDVSIDLALKEYGDCNLAVAVGRQKQSPLLSVDIDGPSGLAKAKELGIRSDEQVWVEKTASGNWQVFYWQPERTDLDRKVAAENLQIDLLVNGLATIPPSIVKGKDGVVRQYAWSSNKSPQSIPASELDQPPQALISWWLSLESTSTAPHDQDYTPDQATDKAWQLAAQPIPNGQRNETLAKIAGWLVLYHPVHIVDSILQSINSARCTPPLPPREVSAIARSINRYGPSDRDGHPRAVSGQSQRVGSLEDLTKTGSLE